MFDTSVADTVADTAADTSAIASAESAVAAWLLPSVALNQPFVLPDSPPGGLTEGDFPAVAAAVGPTGGAAEGRLGVPAAAALAPLQQSGGRKAAQAAAAKAVDRQGYRIGNVNLLARFDSASELTEMLPVAALPGAPSGVRGVANLHGNVVPVLDLAVLLGVSHDAQQTPMLLVLGHGDAAAAVVIDGLPQRRRFGAGDRIEMPAAIPALEGYVQAVYMESAASGAQAGTSGSTSGSSSGSRSCRGRRPRWETRVTAEWSP